MLKQGRIIAVFLLLICFVSSAARANPLELLQINGAIKALDATISALVSHQLEQGAVSEAEAAKLRRQLRSDYGSATVSRKLDRYLARNVSADLNAKVATLSQHPMADRVSGFQQKLAATPASKVDKNMRKMRRLGHSNKRRELINRLDRAVPHAAIAAMQQTALELATAKATGQTIDDAKNRESKRRASLQSRVDALNHYTFRFLSDQQLEQWVERLEQDDIQQYLKQVRRGLAAALR